jgi:hypothetical protein
MFARLRRYHVGMMNRHALVVIVLSALITLMAAAPARAWHDEGHVFAAVAAIEALGANDAPAFFRTPQSAAAIGHGSLDPDVHCDHGTDALRDAEAPQHFLDLEMLQGRELPATRHAFIDLCEELRIEPRKVGYVPYAITELTQRLTLTFVELRRWPDDPFIQSKALVYAGNLAHYAADLHMPLHTSVHFNGRVPRKADGTWGSGPRSDIHARVDSLPTKLPYNVMFTPAIELGEVPAELWPYVVSQFMQSHAHVDRVYAMQAKLPEVRDVTPLSDPEVKAFTIERSRAAAVFLANLYRIAWRDSAKLQPANWLDRDAFDKGFARDAILPQP